LLSEIVVGVRPAEVAEPDVTRALKEMADGGEVVWRSFPIQDPHFAFDCLDFVAPVADDGSEQARRDAELAAEHAYNDWLGEWLRSHRCT